MGVWVLFIDWFLEIGRTSNIFAVGTLRSTCLFMFMWRMLMEFIEKWHEHMDDNDE